MKWTGLNDVREKFLSFFEGKGHSRLKSYPLIPINDNSLLLINSGMAPMKKFFLGQENPPNKRITTCQKCIRTPDIERVGKTSRHGTYFEMLGNFSFGDYFKTEATAFAWEFITEVMELPTDKLWVSIYHEDDEAFEIWTEKVGVSPSRIVRLGKADNFWEIGSGPCGPCSEIYYDRGAEHGCNSPDCAVGCDCDRYVEFWNLVFSQFDSDGNGNYTHMEHPNIDTGMGLERLACIMQGVDNLFEVDTVQKIMNKISDIAKIKYKENEKSDVSLRVITDHIRSTVFLIADGVLPNNEGRGYVLRRLLRRAARHGRLLGIKEPFLHKICETVTAENFAAYPEITEKIGYIKQVVEIEEQRFDKTIKSGLDLLTDIIEKLQSQNLDTLPGEDAFKLYDTFGFPYDLTEEIAIEKNITIDKQKFDELMQKQRDTARANRNENNPIGWDDNANISNLPKTVFCGYDSLESDAKILAIFANDNSTLESAIEGESVTVILDKTPFYAQSGGQVGDIGRIIGEDFEIEITDCKKNSDKFLHMGKITKGLVKVNTTAKAAVDKHTRMSVMRNHTAAHLLQSALRQVLGDHVRQAGSEVDANRVRFDFSHFTAMTAEELAKVEQVVNEAILDSKKVTLSEKTIDEAKSMGALALFSEKYGDVVRVCDVENFSIELCGGTHVDDTAKLGAFKIISESSVAAGVRRIEATTGLGVIALLEDSRKIITNSAELLKLANPNELPTKINSMIAELTQKNDELNNCNQRIAESKLKEAEESMTDINGIKYFSLSLTASKTDILRKVGDATKKNFPNSVAIFTSIIDGKGTIMTVCGAEAIARGLHAGKIVKELAALAGGSGGGRPDSATAGVKEIFRIDEALIQAPVIISKMLENNGKK